MQQAGLPQAVELLALGIRQREAADGPCGVGSLVGEGAVWRAIEEVLICSGRRPSVRGLGVQIGATPDLLTLAWSRSPGLVGTRSGATAGGMARRPAVGVAQWWLTPTVWQGVGCGCLGSIWALAGLQPTRGRIQGMAEQWVAGGGGQVWCWQRVGVVLVVWCRASA